MSYDFGLPHSSAPVVKGHWFMHHYFPICMSRMPDSTRTDVFQGFTTPLPTPNAAGPSGGSSGISLLLLDFLTVTHG